MGDADPRRAGNRNGAGGAAAGPGRNWAENTKDNRPIVPARPLEPEETCCVCCDTLRENEDLSHCRFGCGRQIHTDCLTRCFKHNQSSGKPLLCPLCRTNWGPLGLEILKENSKMWRESKKAAAQDNNKVNSVQDIINGALKGGAASAAGSKAATDPVSKCSSCRRTLMYDAKYQCVICPNIVCCKTCYGVKYHEQHNFLMRP